MSAPEEPMEQRPECGWTVRDELRWQRRREIRGVLYNVLAAVFVVTLFAFLAFGILVMGPPS